MTHIESRPSRTDPGTDYDFYIDCDGTINDIDSLAIQLRQSVTNVLIHVEGDKSIIIIILLK